MKNFIFVLISGDPRFTSKEDMDSKYLRVVTSSYYALAHIISQLKEEDTFTKQYNDLFDNSKFWANLSNDNPLVRKSCYNLIRVLVNKRPCKNIGSILFYKIIFIWLI